MATKKKETSIGKAVQRSKKKTDKPEVKKPDVKVERVMAKHPFTTEEKEEIFKKGSRANSEMFSLESQLSSIKSDYKSKIETQENLRNDCYRKIDDGYEMRETDAVIVFNHPKDNRKTAYRYDATKKDGRGELIEESDMSAADKERDLFDRKPKEEPQAGVNAPSSAGEFSDDQIAKATNVCRVAKKGSTVLLQRHMGIGYPVANRLINRLEELGVVGPMQPGGERDILESPDNPVIPEGVTIPTPSVQQAKDFLNEKAED